GTLPPEALLVAYRGRHHVDLEVRRAPPDCQVSRDLREPQAGAQPASSAANLDDLVAGDLELDRRCLRVLAKHLAFKPAGAPGGVEGQLEGLRKRPAVRRGAGPVHQPTPLPAVDLVMPELDPLHRDAALLQVE